MSDTFCKILASEFSRTPCGQLMWVETAERDRSPEGDYGNPYSVWLLVQRSTDRVLVAIDGPTKEQLCYGVNAEGGVCRRYLSIDSAKRAALGIAHELIQAESVNSAHRRYLRRHSK